MKLTEVIDRYEAVNLKKLAANTQRSHMQSLRQFAVFVGDPDMEDLRDEEASQVALQTAYDRWKDGDSPNRGSSLNLRRAHLTQFLEWCWRRKYLDAGGKDLMKAVAWKYRKSMRDKEPTYLAPIDLVAGMESMLHPRDRAFIAVAMWTGLRKSEITCLRRRDLHLDAGTPYLFCHLGKQGKTMNKPVSGLFEVEMRRWLLWYDDRLRRQGVVPKDEFYLLPAKENGNTTGWNDPEIGWSDTLLKPLSEMTSSENVIHAMLTNLGLEDQTREGIHTIRRSYVEMQRDYAARTGHPDPLAAAQEAVGHESRATTERYLNKTAAQQDHFRRMMAQDPYAFYLQEAAEHTGTVTPLHREEDKETG